MKTPNTILREKIYESLTGNITLNSTTVPVFDMVTISGTSFPYIVITEAIAVPNEVSKGKFSYQVDVSIEVLTAYKGAKDADNITNQCMTLLIPADEASFPDLAPDFDVFDINLDNLRTATPDLFDDVISTRNILTIQYIIDEN